MHNEMKDQYHSVASFYEYKGRKHRNQARYWRNLARYMRELAWLALIGRV
jgi:hypothetical protein